MKPWYQSKTIWVAVLQACVAVFVSISQSNPELGGILVMKSVADVVLRYLTDKPLA